ncbi:MAG: hypothetical protein ACSW8K_10385 [bacterium]|jgi:mRNA-degrading endonuclease RelE of RelBE toxin-antitoxin system|nr:hypothetical protein [Lachnospiraceae bacterium]
MSRIRKAAEKEFKKLSKKEQRRVNRLKRIPLPAPGATFDGKKDAPRQKRWSETDE